MENLEEIIRQLKNKRAREWRKANAEKVKEINNRYWINKAKKELNKKEE